MGGYATARKQMTARLQRRGDEEKNADLPETTSHCKTFWNVPETSLRGLSTPFTFFRD